MDRLRQRAEFLAVADGARVNSAAFTLQSRRRDDSGKDSGLARVGFTVTKKNGTATERNRIRRRLGYRSNIAYRWETGVCFPLARQAFVLAKRDGAAGRAALAAPHPRAPALPPFPRAPPPAPTPPQRSRSAACRRRSSRRSVSCR